MGEIKEHMIPYGQQWIDEEDIREVVETLKSSFLTQGPKIKDFEQKIAEQTGAEYAVAISNGTAALHAACFAAGIKEDDEVITTPITFAASANCALYMGAKPVFADIDPVTYNIDPDDIKRKITNKTKAVIPVHFTGQPCDMDRISKIAEDNGLVVIEDAAHALGALYKGKKVGSISNMTTFSFHPVKHITTGEGGAITTDSPELFDMLTDFRSHGITRDPKRLINNEGPWFYEQQALGYNYRMNDIEAALGLSQLKRLNMFIEKRIEYAEMYDAGFEGFDGIITPKQLKGAVSSWHLYIVQVETEKLKISRKEIFEELRNRNIGVNVHYIPVYYHPYYRKLGYQRGLCPNAEKLYDRMITLPLYPKMRKEDVEYVIRNVKDIVDKNRV